jgi:uncharacterized protein YbjT (DUF2867 family)
LIIVRTGRLLSAGVQVFVTGGTGYVGRPLIEQLLARGHSVHALTRASSEARVPAGARVVVGDALDSATFMSAIPSGATLVHLVGTPHPTPAKTQEFQRVDLTSIWASVAAAQQADVRHLVYVSVAHPAPVMKAYIAVRREGEALIAASGIPATIVRPWYVLGPGRWWPYALVPVYALLRRIPATREGAMRLGLVTRRDMVRTLVRAVEAPPVSGIRIVDVPRIRAASELAVIVGR